MRLSKRCSEISLSQTAAMSSRVAQMKEEGIDVISFNIGEPDFPTPKYICNAAFEAMEEGFTKYSPASGFSDLKKVIAEKLKKDNNLDYTPSQIVVSNGAKQAVFNACLAVCGTGDEVIIPIPCWVSYAEMVKLAGATPVLVNTKEDFNLDLAAIEKAVSDKTKAIIICSPNNPTGVVYPQKDIEKLAELAIKYDFAVISDEIYEKLIYSGEKHFSIGSISQQVYDRTITINGVSKAYAMTGWRIGYAAAPEHVAKAMTSFQSQMTSGACSISQKAAKAALLGPEESTEVMRKTFDERRSFMVKGLSSLDGVTCRDANGAFYLMPDFSFYIGKKFGNQKMADTGILCDFLLENAHVATVPGEAFFAPGKIRFSYSNSLENLKEGIERIRKALTILK